MKSGNQEVSMRVDGVTKVVGTATFPIFESAQEALDNLGEEKLLDKLNAQVRTDEMNRVRGIARSGPGKKALEQKAIARITADEWQTIAGDEAKIRAMVDKYIAQLEAEAKASIGAGASEEGENENENS